MISRPNREQGEAYDGPVIDAVKRFQFVTGLKPSVASTRGR